MRHRDCYGDSRGTEKSPEIPSGDEPQLSSCFRSSACLKRNININKQIISRRKRDVHPDRGASGRV
jgi:hypothetical protein